MLCLASVACGRVEGHPLETAQTTPKLRGAVTTSADPPPQAPTSITAPPPPAIPIYPLTGQLISDPSLALRPVIAVKVDNNPDARPHTGLDKADIVYELRVEGITRFAGLYQSQDADPIGPVRSARTSDINILSNLNRPYLVWSGGNPGVSDEVKAAEHFGLLIDKSEDSAREYFYRERSRVAPHNLYAHMDQLRTDLSVLGGGYGPQPLFAYRNTEEPLPPTAVDASGILVNFGGGVNVQYVWDAERNGWDRFQIDERHPKGQDAFVDTDGGQISPQNVVIMFTLYGPDDVDARSPKAYTVGEGDAIVMTAGKAYNAHWKRDNPYAAAVITDYTGELIGLTPGKTWVALPEQGTAGAFPINADQAQQLLARRK